MTGFSAEHFIPVNDSPDSRRRAFERVALWISGQNRTNAAHWDRITENERTCAECRQDRRQIEALIVTRLDVIEKNVTAITSIGKWTVLGGRLLFALAGLLIAARAAGILK